MSKTLTLDAIKDAAEAKYGSLDIELETTTVSLLNPMRLPKERRDALLAVQKQLTNDEADEASVDQEALLAEALTLVAATPAQAKALLTALDGDLALLASVFESYAEGTQAGEA